MLLKKLPVINFILIASIVGYYFINKADKIVFVDSAEVFEKFRMSSELQATANKELDNRKIYIDSLYKELSLVQDENLQKHLMNQIISERESLDYFQNEFSTEQTPKVWGRIKDYAKQFAADKGYEIVLGAQPNANVVFGSESKNVTVEFINYINNKYEGNK